MDKWTKTMSVMTIVVLTLAAVVGCSESATKRSERPISPAPGDAGEDYGKLILVRRNMYNKPGVEQVADYIRKRSGIRPEIVFADDPMIKFNLMVAAKEPVDAVIMNGATPFLEANRKGLLMPLDDLIDRYGPNLKKKISANLWEWAKGTDGKLYGVPNVSILTPYMPMIRGDWLQKLNLPLPATVDEFEQTMRAFKQSDLSKAPDNEELYPIFLERTMVDQALLGFFLKNGISWWKNDSGLYLPPEMDPDYKAYLQTLQNWYKAKLIHPETFVLTPEKMKEFIGLDKVGVTIGWYGRDQGPYDKIVKLAPNFRYEPLTFAGPYNNGLAQIVPPTNFTVVSATSGNGEGVIRYLDWIVSDRENMITTRWGIPGVMYEYTDKSSFRIMPIDKPDPNRFYQTSFAMIDLEYGVDTEINETPKLLYYSEMLQKIRHQRNYVPFDYQFAFNELLLGSVKTYKEQLDTAKLEAFIRIVAGEKPVSYWDEFVIEWRKMGMDAIIKERNAAYKQAGK